jgi:hypothetical protein
VRGSVRIRTSMLACVNTDVILQPPMSAVRSYNTYFSARFCHHSKGHSLYFLFIYTMLLLLIGGWRKLHNEELHNLYSLSSIIGIIKLRRMRWAGHVARMGEKRNVYRLLVGKPEGERPLGRPRRTWMDNIKMDLLEIGVNVVDLRVP